MASGCFSQFRWFFDLLIRQLQAGDVFFDGRNPGAPQDDLFKFHVEQTNHWNRHREAKDHPDSTAHALVIDQRKFHLSITADWKKKVVRRKIRSVRPRGNKALLAVAPSSRPDP